MGKPHDGVQVEFLQQFFFDAGADAIAEEDAVGDNHAAPAGFETAHRPPQLAHNELQEKQRRLRRLLVLGEIAQDAALFFAPKGRVGHDHVHAVLVAHFPQRFIEGIVRSDLRIFKAMEQQIHLAEQIRQRLGLDAVQRLALELLKLLGLLALWLQMLERLNQKAARAGSGVEDRFTQARVNHRDDKLDQRRAACRTRRNRPAASRISLSMDS